MEVVKAEFPDFKARVGNTPTKHLIDKFIHQCKERMATQLLRDYFDMLEDPNEIDEIEVHALDMAQQLAEVVPAPRALYFGKDATKRKERYDQRKIEGVPPGLKIGVPSFDEITQGMQPHELVIYAGPPGSGKTTSLQHTSVSVYMQDEVVLFISLEVEGEQILRRFDSMLSNINYHALKALELGVGDEEKWVKILERAEKESSHRDIIIRDDIKNCTVEKVATEHMRHKSGLVVVDYLEEMRGRKGNAGWENVQENGRGLKQQARISRTPYVTATQVNRDGDTSYQSVEKIADMLIILRPTDDDRDNSEMSYFLHKYRDGPSRRSAQMRWQLETMDIGEIGGAERFPSRSKSLKKDDRVKEAKLAIATAVRDKGGENNPWSQTLLKKRGENTNGHSQGTHKRTARKRGVVHS